MKKFLKINILVVLALCFVACEKKYEVNVHENIVH